MQETIPGKKLFEDERILWRNRCYGEYAKVRMDLSLSGFSVAIEGEELLGEVDVENEMFLAVFVDGKEYPRVEIRTRGLQSVVFAEKLSPVRHRIDVYRLVEQKEGRIALCSLTARKFLERPAEKKEYITVYGDSISCGYGTEGKNGDVFKNETENPVKSYVFAVAEARNADFEDFSFSGISVSEKIFVPEYTLGEVCFCYSMHNRTRYPYPRKSDIVLVNIGTNDGAAIQNGLGTAEGLERGYEAFCRKLTEYHPDAAFVLLSGFMDYIPEQKEVVDRVCDRLKKELPQKFLRFVFPRNTEGANGHPNAEGSVLGGKLLAEFLEKELPLKN